MLIKYTNERVKNMLNSRKELLMTYNKTVANNVPTRISDIMKAEKVWDLRGVPGNFEQLRTPKGVKIKLYTMEVDSQYRLLFTPTEDRVPTVEILGIVDPHAG